MEQKNFDHPFFQSLNITSANELEQVNHIAAHNEKTLDLFHSDPTNKHLITVQTTLGHKMIFISTAGAH